MNSIKAEHLFILQVLLLFLVSFKTLLCNELNVISAGQSISGNETITSKSGRFELGFFKPVNSTKYYIGIWYKNIPVQTVVWVANRDQPLTNSFSSTLKLLQNGVLVLYNQSKIQVWSSGAPSNSINYPVAVLKNSGNLILRDAKNSSFVVWQSFDHPTDTWLPGAKLGLNKLTGKRQVYISWNNPVDPAPGTFSLELDSNGTNQYFVMKNNNTHWTCGFWPGRVSAFGLDKLADNHSNMVYVSNEKENYFTYAVTNASILTRFMMDSSGQLRQLKWETVSQQWELNWARPSQQCEIYAYCGEYGACNQYSVSTCSCLQGFKPRNPTEWNIGNHSHGCVRNTPLKCDREGKGQDGFLMIHNIRLAANSKSLKVKSSEECEMTCLNSCSCTAYTYDTECLLWKEDLLNIQYLSFGDNLGRDIHLRLAQKEVKAIRDQTKQKFKSVILGAAIAGTTIGLIFGLSIWVCKMRKLSSEVKAIDNSLIIFKYSDLRSVTKKFSEKLGEGGFGSVFKGKLPNSTAIAVKRLKCLCHGQDEKQFRTEVSTIGTIHHINLIQLRGFCIEGTKKFLVYDYMPKGSLESHLFSKVTNILDWKTRYHIALGTARGLAYLHEKCRDCIIHCDIKPENILLDSDFDPKVSDFGLAKLLGRNFSRVLTTIKGTRGYLAPEWIYGGAITPKADVFSYGMLLFEIVSGQRNSGVKDDDNSDYFPAQAAKVLSSGHEILTLLDPNLKGNANKEELLRICRVACWCIQDDKDRPSMGRIVQILEGLVEVTTPPMPRFLYEIAVIATGV